MDVDAAVDGTSIPSLEPGITWLRVSNRRTTAHHRLVLSHLQEQRGPVFWVDARDTANTYALYALSPSERLLDSIRVARAWTAHQHQTLVRRVVRKASARTRLIVVPNVCSLYRDDDLRDWEGPRLLNATLRTLHELASSLQLPVFLTAPSAEREFLSSHADHELVWEDTDYGTAMHDAATDPRAYRDAHWCQTTLTYWIEQQGVTTNNSEWPVQLGPQQSLALEF